MVQKSFFSIDEIARRLHPSADNPQEGELMAVVRWVNRAGKLHFSDVNPDRFAKIPISVIRLMIAENPTGSLQRSLSDMLDGLPIPGSIADMFRRQELERKAREDADPLRRVLRQKGGV